jgi:cytochrome c peroxidase
MYIKKINILLCFVVGFLSLSAFLYNNEPIKFIIPKNWPQPVYDFKTNPLTNEGFKLGRELFYDPILSADSTISCASCHLSFTAFSHTDHKLSHGINGLIGTRNSSSLVNLAWNTSFMWDGGVNNLEVQAINPITNPVEMNSKLVDVIFKLNRSSRYKKLFREVYKDTLINSQRLFKSLAQFTGNLVSYNSRYDSVMRKEKEFTAQEKNGYVLFQKNCGSCHKEPLFTNQQFENNGLSLDTALKDFGRMKITLNPKDSLRFKVPTLRNIEFSYPYMHDGRFKNLSAVLKHYTSGIQQSKTLSKPLEEPIILSSNEKVDLTAFLLTLTDRSFLFNERFRYKANN